MIVRNVLGYENNNMNIEDDNKITILLGISFDHNDNKCKIIEVNSNCIIVEYAGNNKQIELHDLSGVCVMFVLLN